MATDTRKLIRSHLRTRAACPSLVGVVLLLFVVAPASTSANEPLTREAGSQVRARYSGRLRTEIDYRSLDDADDLDAYGYWYLQGRGLFNGHVGFYTSGRAHEDLGDDPSPSLADDPFVSLDVHEDDLDLRVLQGYVDVHDQRKRFWLRAGRQYLDVADFIHVDGAQLMLFEREFIGFRVFAGSPVSYFTTVSGDFAAGGSMVTRPWKGNRTRFTFARYEDDSEQDEDDHYVADVWQQWPDNLRTRAKLSVLNGEFRMGSLTFFYTAPEGVTDVLLGVHRWGEDYEANTRVYSPLYAILGDQPAYTYGHARVTQGILPWLLVSPGAAYRLPDDDPTAHSREYGHYDVSLILEPCRSFQATAAVEFWDVEDGDRFFGVSGELLCRYGHRFELRAGAAYVDYEYTRASDLSFALNGSQLQVSEDGTRVESSPDAITYYARGKWNVASHVWLNARVEVEDNSLEEDLSVRARGAVEVRF